MFQLESLTTVRVLDVRTLASKDRKPDELPGAQLLLQATLGAGVLAMFDGFLPGMLYRRPSTKTQGELDGIETAELTAIGEHVKRVPWVYEQTGCEITIDFGLGGGSNLVLSDVKVHRVSMRPEQNGVVLQWTADALGLNDTTRGRLTGLKRTDVKMLLTGPEVDPQEDIEGTANKGQRGANGAKPKPAAPAAAPAAAQTPEGALAAAVSGDGQASKDALDGTGNNPFGRVPDAGDADAVDKSVDPQVDKSAETQGGRRGRKTAAVVE